MDEALKVGRWVGALLLLKLAAGPVQFFVLLGPVLAPPGFLANAAPHALELRLAALLGFGLALASLALVIVAWPLFRRLAPRLALAFGALTVVGMVAALQESLGMLGMLSLSQAYAAAPATDAALYEALRGVVAATRNWAHYANLELGGFATLVLGAILWRARLVPRALSGALLATVLLQMYAVGRPYFGLPVAFDLLPPVGLAHLALAGWLLWRGFAAERTA
jgi:hypothetical protein